MIFLFCFGILVVIAFQLALLLGAPWGHLTQGGQVEGALHVRGRIIAALSIPVLAFIALAIASADGRWPYWPGWTAWVAVAVLSISTLLNWITPSPAERKLWGPVMTVMLIIAITLL